MMLFAGPLHVDSEAVGVSAGQQRFLTRPLHLQPNFLAIFHDRDGLILRQGLRQLLPAIRGQQAWISPRGGLDDMPHGQLGNHEEYSRG
jgi:hypothetical protein